jgi:nucleotide-binding universal stress UspA family protein
MERIAVGVDGSRPSERALRWAVREAELHGATLDLLHAYVIHPYAGLFGGADRDIARTRLTSVATRNQELLSSVKWTTTLVDAAGTTAAALLDATRGADLLVVGSRGAGGFSRLTLGSTAYRLAAHSPAPVAVIAGDEPADDGARHLVVGVDDAPASRRALRWALGEAERRSTGVTVIHSYLLPVEMAPSAALNVRLYERALTQAREDAVALVDRVVEAAQIPAGVKVDKVIETGPPAGTLLDHAHDKLLVTGTTGQGSFSRAVFGSVSQQVLHHSEHPVVVVP